MSDTNERSVASAGSAAKCRPIGAYVHTPTYDDLVAEIARLRLTDEEREAIANGIYLCEGEAGQANENINANAWAKTAGVLRGLLERTK